MDAPELTEYLTDVLGADAIVDSRDEYGTHTLTVTRDAYVRTIEVLRDDRHLAFDLFDCSFGVDEREAGFSVINILYSTTKRHRVLVKVFADGGRDKPVVPSVAHVFEGANWMEREAWDMYGIEFEGHPGLAPRILTVENFEGWPLRKDFHLASRAAKPWPGVKEPAETDEDGNVIVKEPRIGDAPGPMPLDELMAEQARRANPSLFEDEEGDDADADAGEPELGSAELTAGEPTVGEPVAGEAVPSEPAANEPAANEPAANEPAANEPAASEPATGEPADEDNAGGDA